MTKTKKLLLKQFSLLSVAFIIALLFAYLNGSVYFPDSSFTVFDYEIFEFIIAVAVVFYGFLAYPYIRRIRKKGDTKNLNKLFRFTNWVIVAILLLPILFALYKTFHYVSWSGSGYLENIWGSVKYHLSWSYMGDTEYGFLHDIKNFIYTIPLVVTITLFYWANKVNKALSITKNI